MSKQTFCPIKALDALNALNASGTLTKENATKGSNFVMIDMISSFYIPNYWPVGCKTPTECFNHYCKSDDPDVSPEHFALWKYLFENYHIWSK